MTAVDSLNFEEAVKLINGKKTTIDDICKFLFAYIQDFQDEREEYHLLEFKNEHQYTHTPSLSSVIDEHVEILEKRIQADVKKFAVKFADASIDKILDGINEKRFRTKKGPQNFLVLLSTLKELYEVEN